MLYNFNVLSLDSAELLTAVSRPALPLGSANLLSLVAKQKKLYSLTRKVMLSYSKSDFLLFGFIRHYIFCVTTLL